MAAKWQTIYRPAYGDSTNGGASSDQDMIAVSGTMLADNDWSNTDMLHETTHDASTCTKRPIYDITEGFRGHRHLVPRIKKAGIGPMFGGNYANVDGEMLPIHDRWESQEQYNALSR